MRPKASLQPLELRQWPKHLNSLKKSMRQLTKLCGVEICATLSTHYEQLVDHHKNEAEKTQKQINDKVRVTAGQQFHATLLTLAKEITTNVKQENLRLAQDLLDRNSRKRRATPSETEEGPFDKHPRLDIEEAVKAYLDKQVNQSLNTNPLYNPSNTPPFPDPTTPWPTPNKKPRRKGQRQRKRKGTRQPLRARKAILAARLKKKKLSYRRNLRTRTKLNTHNMHNYIINLSNYQLSHIEIKINY